MVDVPPSQSRLTNYFHLTGMTILYYDHLITFGDEYWRVWKNLRSGGSWYFLVNRYFAFFANIGVLIGNFFPFTSEERYAMPVCTHYTLFRQLVLIISEVIVGANLLLRIYAIYERDNRILVLVLSISAVLIGFACWSVIGQKADVSLVEGCHISLDRIKAIRTAVSWEALFIYDVLIVSLTLLKAYRERSRRRRHLLANNDLFGLIVRDGAIYFLVMAVANLVNTLTFYILVPALRGMLSTLATSISVTMMSRLMFNLRQGAAMSEHNYDTTVPPSNLRFKHKRNISSSTDEEETLPTVQYETQPPLAEEPGVPRTDMEGDIEMIPLPAVQEVLREKEA